MMEADLASCAVPGGTAVEEGTALYVALPMLCGLAKEMHRWSGRAGVDGRAE